MLEILLLLRPPPADLRALTGRAPAGRASSRVLCWLDAQWAKKMRLCLSTLHTALPCVRAQAYYRRASANFQLRKFKDALKDFKSVVKVKHRAVPNRPIVPCRVISAISQLSAKWS